MRVTILTERELRGCVAVDEQTIEVVSDAFAALAAGGVVMPPILRLDIAAMGSDAEDKNEIHPEALDRVDRFVCDRRAQSRRLGEWRHAIAAGPLAEGAGPTNWARSRPAGGRAVRTETRSRFAI